MLQDKIKEKFSEIRTDVNENGVINRCIIERAIPPSLPHESLRVVLRNHSRTNLPKTNH